MLIFCDNSINRSLVLVLKYSFCKFCICTSVFKEIMILWKKKYCFFYFFKFVARKCCEKKADFFLVRFTAKKIRFFFHDIFWRQIFFEKKKKFFILQNIMISLKNTAKRRKMFGIKKILKKKNSLQTPLFFLDLAGRDINSIIRR